MIKYYISFTDYQGNTFNADGSPLYEITNFDISSLQTLNIGSQSSGAGAGKVTFNPLTFTLASDKLTDKLDQVLASGTPLAQVNLVGYETGAGGHPIQVVHDVFKLAAVKSDAIDIDDGLHAISMEYGDLVESTTALTASGTPGKTSTLGWNAVGNVADNSLTSEITSSGLSGGSVSLPTFDPTKAVAAPVAHAPGDTFVRFIGANGDALGGGWIQIDSANFSLLQTLNIGSGSAGAGAGEVAFNPLTLNLPPSSLDPTLAQMEASGTEIKQIDVAEYSPAAKSAGDLVADYRFNLTAIASHDFAVNNGVADQTYTFEYGDEQIATFAAGSSTPTVEGWNRVNNISNTTYSLGTVPTTQASVESQLANLGTTVDSQTKYYLSFTDYSGDTSSKDGSPLYQVTNLDISSLQTLNIGSQSSGAGAGKITFNPLTFTLASDRLTELLDQVAASGTAFAQVNLVGYDTGRNGQPVQVLRDVFKLAAVKSDSIDTVSGLHNLSMEYGGLVESVQPILSNGTLGTEVTAGWNRVTNTADNSLTSVIDGGGLTSVALPTLDPTKAVAPPTPSTNNDTYVRFTSSTGATLGGGWIALDSGNFSLLQTLNIGSGAASGAGKVAFNPLSLTFATGSLEPTLLQLEASGAEIKQIDVAAYASAGGALTQDFRFGLAGVASCDDSVSNGVATQTYTFEYGTEQIATYAAGSSTPAVQGWNRVTNVSNLDFSLGTVPKTEQSVRTQLATVGATETDHTKYYLTFTDYDENTFSRDGSPLYQVTDVDLSALQTLNIGAQSSGTGAGKITFNPLTFTLGSDKLTAQLDQALASGTPFAEVNLIGYATGAGGKPVQVLDDAFKLAALKSDTITPNNGLHQISMEFGGLVESDTPLTASGAPGATVTAGWNRVSNISDNSLTSEIGGGSASVSLPTLDPTKAIAPADATKTSDMFVHFTNSVGAPLGGGWFKIDAGSFSLLQTLNIGSQTSGSGAGKVTFNPLALTFSPGAFGPTLLQMEASGTTFGTIDVAAYGNAGGGISQDYRFTLAAVKTIDDAVSNGLPTENYTFEFGTEQIAAYAPGQGTPTVQGWDRVTNLADNTSFSLGAVPKTETQVLGEVACYGAGVRLRTDRGEIAVEALRVGDRLVTVSGQAKPIVWIGRRRYACADAPEPGNVWPIVVAAGALGEARPARDLWLSPGHALFVDGCLVEAVRLVNGTTIRQVPRDFVDYWHVELDRHDIVYAERLEAETYLDTGNRAHFEGGAALALHPDFGPDRPEAVCAPFLADGPPLAALRGRLLARAKALGYAFEAEPDLHALADGRRMEPIRLHENRIAFVFPWGVRQAALASRTWRPMDALAESGDGRTLGVCVARLQIDGRDADLAGAEFSEGWSYFEPEAGHRWTSGRAALPAGLRIAVVDLNGEGLYASAPVANARAAGPVALLG